MSEEASSMPSLGDLERRLARRPAPDAFTEAELEGLPGPVRRYFLAGIAHGTPLATAARLEMRGSIKIGRWVPFRAHQVLAPSEGFVWAARVAGIVTGSDAFVDGHGGMRWKLFGVVPFVRASGPDYARSAAARAGGEAIWLPTSLLPRFGVRWKAEDATNVAASYGVDGIALEVRYVLNEEGQVRSLTFDRWGDPDRSGAWGVHPCGGDVTGYRRFAGLTIPSEGRLGWFYGTDRWSEGEFFRYEITQVRLLERLA
jgi:hypothetical protein